MSLRHLDVCGNALEQLDGIEQLVCLTWLDASSNGLKASMHTSRMQLLQFCQHRTDIALLLQSALQLRLCSQLRILTLARNQLTCLDGLESELPVTHYRPFMHCMINLLWHA